MLGHTHTHTHTQDDDLKSLLSFLKMGSRQKQVMALIYVYMHGLEFNCKEGNGAQLISVSQIFVSDQTSWKVTNVVSITLKLTLVPLEIHRLILKHLLSWI
jgi:hypothetical protein